MVLRLKMSVVNSNCEIEVTTFFNTIDQNASPSNIHLNINEFEAVVEPYAMDVWKKCCKICKVSKEFKSENNLKQHFIDKHPNVSMEYYDVKCRNLVKCSGCDKYLKANGFSNHKFKVHQNKSQSEGIVISDRRVQCSSCGAKILKKNFSKHVGKVHARHLIHSISQNEFPNEVRQNISKPEEIEEPCVIDVPLYICNLCKGNPMHSGMKNTMLNIPFEVKHSNVPPDFEILISNRCVQCNSCGVKMLTKNFPEHGCKVHNRILTDIHDQHKVLPTAHHNSIEEPYAIDVMVKICKVCKAEYVTHKFLKKHFEAQHESVPIKFDVVKSYKFVRCSACRTQIKTKNFTRHKQRCVHSQTHIGISSLKALQVEVCHEAATGKSTHSLTNETWNDKCAMKLIRNESEASMNAHILAPRLFGCKICDASNILEQNIMKHHMEHRINSNQDVLLKAFDIDFYLLDLKKQVPRLQCEICRVECNENHLQGHMRRVHSKSLSLSENERATGNQSKGSLNDRVQVNTGQQLISIKVYKCLACDARDIMESNLIRHHLKKHAQISIEVNIFQIFGRIIREKCNICERCLPEGRIKEHKKRCHFNKTRLAVLHRTADMPNWSKVSNRTFIQNTQVVNTELYKCLKCRAVVSKDKLEVHRKNHKMKVSETKDVFQLIGIKNVIKCAACLKFIEPEYFQDHIKKHSTMIFVSGDGKPLFKSEPENKQRQDKSFDIRQNSKYLPKYRNIFKCRACEIIKGKKKFIVDTGLDGMEIQKHQRTHRKHFIEGNIFHLFMVKVKCNVCDRYMKKDKVEKHMKVDHNWNYDINFVPLYKCGSCDARGISKRNLDAHHSRTHSFPIERNNFKICAIKQKIECECCGKRYMEGRPKKHHLKTCLQRALAIDVCEHDQLAT